MINLKHLGYFNSVVQHDGFSNAAEKLEISQSALSIQIKKLEISLGTTLIDRDFKKLKLTKQGQEVFELTKVLFEKIATIETEILDVVNRNQNYVSIGASPIIGASFLANVSPKMIKKYKDVAIDIVSSKHQDCISQLREGIHDYIVIDETDFHDSRYDVINIGERPHVLVAAKMPNSINDIFSEKLFYRRERPKSDKATQYLEQKYDRKFTNKAIVDGSLNLLCEVVKEGQGYAILPSYAVERDVAEGKLVIVEKIDKVTDSILVIVNKKKRDMSIISSMITYLKVLSDSQKA